MRKIYIAKRIASNSFDDAFVQINPTMDADDLVCAYRNKKVTRSTYIHNGHWILRPVSEGVLEENKLPNDLGPQHIMDMVVHKLEDSDALVAVINSGSYGTIAELGYTVGTGRHAVYVLPDTDVTHEELEDLWMSFHLAFRTNHLWQDIDILSIDEFKQWGIESVADYKKYVLSIIPKFLQ